MDSASRLTWVDDTGCGNVATDASSASVIASTISGTNVAPEKSFMASPNGADRLLAHLAKRVFSGRLWIERKTSTRHIGSPGTTSLFVHQAGYSSINPLI